MNFHAPVVARSYCATLVQHYAAVRARLGWLPLEAREFEAPAAPVLMLPPPAPQVATDPIPDQRGKVVMPMSAETEVIAARRALAIFAKLRQREPLDNSILQLQTALAAAFKVDLDVILGPSRRRGPVRIRQIGITLASGACQHSKSEIARRFNRDHSTANYARRKFAGFLDGATSQIGSADGR